ncbi:uncharacterized protein LOC128545954 [Mercenaria mercenaria]|uniref:uncharacterized protein LOC128545954 n=1 Tax=Mercenaria mercenaria TaxID=6596 RepID=UPI001E1E21EA|nr:uncharacterized protein LOC128545954 [Mercenaria mercenaria]
MPGRGKGVKRKTRAADSENSRLLQPDPDIWIIGDSLPYWAGVRAQQLSTPDLKAPAGIRIGWWGIRGMSWEDFRHSIEVNVLLGKPPKMILIHLGGNDITKMPVSELRGIIQCEVTYLREAMPDSKLIWVNILQRLSWRTDKYGIQEIESIRKRINRWGRQQVSLHPQHDIVSIDIDYKTPGFFRDDGVHLSDVGLAFYLDAVNDAIIKNL